ncbi:MAG TPA: hypothetical protein VH012_02735 [Acidimicrobiales bacterium]|nr:hypothetical protein [Acidimicrobiales bacterium]
MAEAGAVFIGCHWRDRRSELAFVTRCIAGAASRLGPVSVLVPGPIGRAEADGAFDLVGMGAGHDLRWPRPPGSRDVVVVDELTPAVAALLGDIDPRSVFFLSDGAGTHGGPSWRRLHLTHADDNDASPWVTVLVPVNPLAQLHRHHGFGFTGYQLVLSDEPGDADDPPPAVAWLSAAYPAAEIVLVGDGVASAWKGRSLRGTVAVDTRMDLWRLVAHAAVCIDLAPGAQIARECVEALRFGTPIIVAEGPGPAVTHARAGGGSTFGDPGELVAAVAGLQAEDDRASVSEAGRRYADERYGDPDALMEQVRTLLART